MWVEFERPFLYTAYTLDIVVVDTCYVFVWVLYNGDKQHWQELQKHFNTKCMEMSREAKPS